MAGVRPALPWDGGVERITMLRTTLLSLAVAALTFVRRPAGAFNLDFVALAAGN